jgi:hypothetical protein
MAGPFLSASWYRVAALRPALRAHARIQRQRFRGQAWYVLHDSAAGKLHRFSPAAYRVVQLMDGERTIDAIWHEVAAEAGADAPTQDEVIRLLAQLHAGDLLQADLPPDIDELAERGRKQKRQKLCRASSTRCRSASRCGTPTPSWPHLAPAQPLFGPSPASLWLLGCAAGAGPRRRALARADGQPQRSGAGHRQPAAALADLSAAQGPARAGTRLRRQGRRWRSARDGHHAARAGADPLRRRERRRVPFAASGAARWSVPPVSWSNSSWPASRCSSGCWSNPACCARSPSTCSRRRRVDAALQRQPAAALRRLLRPRRPDRDRQPRQPLEPVLAVARQTLPPRRHDRRAAAGEPRRAALVRLLRCRFVHLPHAGDDRHHAVHRRRVLLHRRRAGDLGGDHDVRAADRQRAVVRRVEPGTAAHAHACPPGHLRRRWRCSCSSCFAVPMPLRTHAEGVVWVPENAEVRAAADGFVEHLLVAPEATVASGDGCWRPPSRRSPPRSSRAGRACASRGAVRLADVRRARAGGGDSGGPAAGAGGAGACRRETRRAAGDRRRARRAQAGAGRRICRSAS